MKILQLIVCPRITLTVKAETKISIFNSDLRKSQFVSKTKKIEGNGRNEEQGL